MYGIGNIAFLICWKNCAMIMLVVPNFQAHLVTKKKIKNKKIELILFNLDLIYLVGIAHIHVPVFCMLSHEVLCFL